MTWSNHNYYNSINGCVQWLFNQMRNNDEKSIFGPTAHEQSIRKMWPKKSCRIISACVFGSGYIWQQLFAVASSPLDGIHWNELLFIRWWIFGTAENHRPPHASKPISVRPFDDKKHSNDNSNEWQRIQPRCDKNDFNLIDTTSDNNNYYFLFLRIAWLNEVGLVVAVHALVKCQRNSQSVLLCGLQWNNADAFECSHAIVECINVLVINSLFITRLLDSTLESVHHLLHDSIPILVMEIMVDSIWN